MSKGLGVSEALSSDADPAAKLFVDLVPDSAYATGYKLQPSVAVVEAIGIHHVRARYFCLTTGYSCMGLRATPTMCCRPYFRNVSMYPSAIYPQTGDSEIDSLVYTLTVRGPAASALPP